MRAICAAACLNQTVSGSRDAILGQHSAKLRAVGPIDIRGVGGFVIAPGALRDDGLYGIPDGDPLDVLHSPELPDFLRQVLTSTREEISPEPSSKNALAPVKAPKEITFPPVRIDMENPRLRAWVESALQQEIQALAQAGKGGRNEQLNRSAFAVYQLVAAGWIKDEHAHATLLDAASVCGLLKDDGRTQVLATLASGKRGGLGQPRQAPEEFASDDEDAALGAEIACRWSSRGMARCTMPTQARWSKSRHLRSPQTAGLISISRPSFPPLAKCRSFR